MKKEEKKYGLLKGIGITILIAFVLSWLLEAGQFQDTSFVAAGMKRLGLYDIVGLVDGSVYFCLSKILLLLLIGGLYGILGKIGAYDRLVTSIAKKFVKHEKITVVVLSVLIAGLTSVITQSFAILIFIPFIIAILSKMKLDKLTILAVTFGSMLIGIMGATYGTDGLVRFNSYMNVENTGLLIRTGVLVIGLVLFNFFILSRIDKEKNDNDKENAIFDIEPAKETKKRSALPIIIMGVLFFILVILAYLNWNGFGVTVFDNFHTYLTTKVKIGKDFFIFSDLLGANATALGTWDLTMLIPILFLFTVIIGLCYRVKFNDFMDNFIAGLKKMLVPVACVIGITSVFAIINTSYYTATITNKILGLTNGFNVITMTIAGLITSIFHVDLGFSGFLFNNYGYFTVEYPDYLNTINVMLPTLYGLAQFFIPTSAVLYVGLSSLKVKYSEWFKFIWRFIIGMLLCLIIIFVLMATL